MGQGRATAFRLAREGANVIAADISGAEKDTAAEMPDVIKPFGVDVTKSSEMEALIRAATEAHGRLDILCNVVGISVGVAQGALPDIDEQQWDDLLDINLKSVYLGMKYGIPAIVASGGGSVINWSSVAALTGRPGGATYGATKAGILALTRSAALEWGKQKVRVNAICPGVIYPTGMTLDGEKYAPDVMKWAAAKAALDRTGHPDEVAAVAAFLASDDSSFMTGTYLVVDGGWTAGG
jgi:NAD(P)-dependent dehydrogenase (short-subunit alcohol dehydrogenase family)